MNSNITWQNFLAHEAQKDYYEKIKLTIDEDIKNGISVYPSLEDVLNAFKFTELNDIKVVILGQDPYHGEWQSHGLAFSVRDGVKIPPSLNNLFKELHDDIWCPTPKSGNLESWANSWVFLLNTSLTVREWEAGSHSRIWWETFTDNTIKVISQYRENIVFMLWWNHAKSKRNLIDESKHLIIESSHPSPLSASRWFFGSKPFSKANNYLKSHGVDEIKWCS